MVLHPQPTVAVSACAITFVAYLHFLLTRPLDTFPTQPHRFGICHNFLRLQRLKGSGSVNVVGRDGHGARLR